MKKQSILWLVLILLGVGIIVYLFAQRTSSNVQAATTQEMVKPEPASTLPFTENDHMALGNPDNAKPEATSADHYLLVKPQYTVSYSNSLHNPNWVSWHLTASDIGDAGRHDSFRADSALPDDFYEVTPADYAKSGFDKGHLCPSADRTSTVDHNKATFLMTNMVPQAPNNNRIVWESLESYCRQMVEKGDELYIIAGPYGKGGVGSKGFAETIKDGVVVPAYTWKIVVVLPEGSEDLRRIDTSTRVISVMIPNTQECSNHSWQDFSIPVDSLESLTHYDFLSNVPEKVQKVIEMRKNIDF